MLTFEKFSGINNVLPRERLGNDALTVAKNVDIGLTGELTRRSGFTRLSTDAHTNLFRAEGFTLATVGLNGDLKNLGSGTVLYPSLGHGRIWYAALPDGRVAFSNDLICGITDGLTATGWGVPIPHATGALTEVAGGLHPGDYQWQLTYVRASDGLEGGAAYSGAPVRVASGGVFLSGLPVQAGYKIRVYLSSHDGGAAFYAGETQTGLFTFTGTNDALTLPCRTDHIAPAIPGKCLTFWRGRTLLAEGGVLYASKTNEWEAFDHRRDFKQFDAEITSVVPVDDGIYVGTARELAFLAGVEWDRLQYRRVVDGPVVLGSGVPVRGELIQQGEGAGLGSAMICIADGRMVAGFNGGGLVRLTEGRYVTDATEVFATFRHANGVPQYLAIPR